mgnify:CR=1 FL=1
MKTHVIAMPSEADKKTVASLEREGFSPKVWGGFDNAWEHRTENFGWKLSTNHTYDYDALGQDYKIGGKTVGIALGHWTLWKALEYMGGEDYYHIMEADVKLREGWKPRLEQAMKDVPNDWDMIYAGNCCTQGVSERVKGEVYRSRPQCLHWYMVRRKALKTLIDTNQKAESPIDIQLVLDSHPKLNVYAILPRLADQHNTDLVP